MAIVFVNRFFSPDHSATSQLLTDLCTALAQQGQQVTVITSRQIINDPNAQLATRENLHGVRVRRVWSPNFGRMSLSGRSLDYLGFYLSAAWCAFRVVQPGDTLVAKTDPPMLSVAMGWVAALRGAGLVNWLQDLFPEVATALGIKALPGPVAGLLKRIRNRSLQQAEMNVVLGRLMAERLRAEAISGKQIRVIHNWANGQQLYPLAAKDNPLRHDWDLEQRFVIEYSGNMGRAHEFETLLDAAELLIEHQHICFLLIGDGVLRPALERDVTRRGLSNIKFMSYQKREDLLYSLNLGDVHLVSLNPKLEGLIVPSKFYGIAAVGRACIYIGDPQGEIGQIISCSGCGYCIAPGDGEALAQRVLSLASDAHLCVERGKQARAVFDERFDRQLGLQAWFEVLGVDTEVSKQ